MFLRAGGNQVAFVDPEGGIAASAFNVLFSRTLKNRIRPLTAQVALEAFDALEPVRYHYKANDSGERVGFIAEDVPDLVAVPGRGSIRPADITAVVTRVTQVHRDKIAALESENAERAAENERQRIDIERQNAENTELRARLEAVEKALGIHR